MFLRHNNPYYFSKNIIDTRIFDKGSFLRHSNSDFKNTTIQAGEVSPLPPDLLRFAGEFA
jgi:hypothetical protein